MSRPGHTVLGSSVLAESPTAPERPPLASAPERAAGRRPTILILGPSGDSRGGVAATVRTIMNSPRLALNYRLVLLPTQVDGRRERKLARAVRSFGSLALRGAARRVDLVHLHVSVGPSFARKVMALMIARVLRVPVVLHVHSGGFRQSLKRRGLRGWIGRHALVWMLEQSDAVVTLTDGWRKELAEHARLRRWHIVPNAPDLQVVPRRLPSSANPTILFLGHLYRDKGVYELVRAFARLRADGRRFRLVIAGQGREAAALGDEVERLGLTESVDLPGWVGPEKKAELLASAACLVLPSYHEGLPLTVLEAMLAGVPIVATAVGGVPEVARNESEALLVPPRDVEALAQAIDRVLSDVDLAARLVEAAARRVRADYTEEALAKRLESIFEELLTRR